MTASFFVTTLISWLLIKRIKKSDIKDNKHDLLNEIVFFLRKVSLISFGLIFPFGVVRLVYFVDFEVKPYNKIGFLEVLVIKHSVLFLLAFLGIYLWLKITKEIKR